jgi:anti-sigma B factor antagonist
MPSEKLFFELLPGTGDEHIYRLLGPLTLSNLFAFQEVLRQQSGTTILDLTGVPYMDSAGLGVLVNSYVSHQQRGQRLVLAGVNERVRELFKLTKVDSVLEVVPNLEAAYRALGRPERGVA